jgi:hypothetical protein
MVSVRLKLIRQMDDAPKVRVITYSKKSLITKYEVG